MSGKMDWRDCERRQRNRERPGSMVFVPKYPFRRVRRGFGERDAFSFITTDTLPTETPRREKPNSEIAKQKDILLAMRAKSKGGKPSTSTEKDK